MQNFTQSGDLSLEKCVQTIYSTLPSLVTTLEDSAAGSGIGNTTCKGLLESVHQYKFIAITTHLLMDVLPFLSCLSKTFQKESVNFSTIDPMVSCTIEGLRELKTVPGSYEDKLGKLIHEVEMDGKVKVVYSRPLEETTCQTVKAATAANFFRASKVHELAESEVEELESSEPESTCSHTAPASPIT
jgi:hypothetical protein